MPLDRNLFIEQYLSELNDNVKLINNSIINLKKDPDNEEELNIILRAVHTIKGSSRMLKFLNVEKVAHGLENVLKGIKEKRYTINNSIIQLVFITTDFFKKFETVIRETKEDNKIDINTLISVFDKAVANEPYNLNDIKLHEEAKSKDTAQEDKTKKEEKKIVKLENYDTIRIKVEYIDKIVRSVNNLIIKQFQLKKDYETLTDIENSFENFFNEINQQNLKKDVIKQKETDLMKKIQNVKKNFLEHISLIERNSFEVQEQIFNLRMLPLDIIFSPLNKMVEETAIALNKEINLTISGSDIMLDKLILERINDPIIHIIRNCIDHGIEYPEDRIRKGKSKSGNIDIKCMSESGNIIIKIKDDGAGIDYDKVRRKAVEQNLISEDEVKNMSNSELNAFLFMPGFSTKTEVNELSGRGVGMDIVRHNIEKIKGKINILSEKDKGTEFILTLPLSLATVEGFFIYVSKKKFYIPSNFVKEIIILNDVERINILNKEVFKLRDKIIPLYHLSHLLQLEEDTEVQKNYVMVLESIDEVIGVVVDSVIEYSSLIFKSLPKNLHKLQLVQGIVFDENYNIVPIFYVPSLIKKFKQVKNIDIKKRAIKTTKTAKSILVVDDSLNTREIEKSILELENYNVTTANDGIEGLEKLKEMNFDLIITDINMPRMDGLTMVENIRKNPELRNIPVVVVSSYDSSEFKDRIKSLGINAYIVKSLFDRDNLISVVNKLLNS